jgi:hypothetical protein
MTLDEQVTCIRRELAMRRNVYPKFIANGRMTPEQADHEMQCMQAVLVTLTLNYPQARRDAAAQCVRELRNAQFDQAADWLDHLLSSWNLQDG